MTTLLESATFWPNLWFVLLGALLFGYAVLDGFDLGVGIMHFVSRTDHDRRVFINAIGPIWDGNEVWLVAFGGALFAAFPEAYATIFSGFYTAFMLLLFSLIFRAVSIEFRSKVESPRWRSLWDFSFFASSLLASFLFGVAIGNSMMGVPLNERGHFIGTFGDLLGPYPILCGFLVISLFAMHGTLYLFLKVPHGELHDRLREWMWHTWGVFLVLYLLTTVYTLIAVPRVLEGLGPEKVQLTLLLVLVNVCAVANIPRSVYHDRPIQAFASSCFAILALVSLFGLALWPNLVTASNQADFSLTVARAASSPATLKLMALIAAIGIPLVLTYTFLVYWTFRRRVRIEEHSY